MKNLIFISIFSLACILACKKESTTSDCDAKNYPSIDFNGKLYVQPVGSPGFTDPHDWQGSVDYCNNLDFDGCDDWYLPSYDELQALYLNKAAIGDFADVFGSSYYWSSTIIGDPDKAREFSFYTGDTKYTYKTEVNRCRCVRR